MIAASFGFAAFGGGSSYACVHILHSLPYPLQCHVTPACMSAYLCCIVVMAIDIVYLRSFYFLKSYKSTFTTLLRCSGFFAVFHALAALVPESAVFFTNVASVCKVLWVYCYLGLMLTNFNPHGHGGEIFSIYILC